MKTLSRIALIAGLTCSLSSVSQAHPGHGEVGPTHYFASPEHLGMMLAIVIGGLLIVWSTNQRSRRNAKA